MPLFPLFVDLAGKKCLVVGGGPVATRKVETLLHFNAEIVVVSPQTTERIRELKARGRLRHIERAYSEEDMEEAFLVLAATSDGEANDAIFRDAQRKGVLVNIADDPHKCTFVFPAVVKRGDLVVGISSSGNYPVLSKAVREKLDDMLPKEFDAERMEMLKGYRQKAIRHIKDEAKRKEFLKRLLDEAFFGDGMENTEGIRSKVEKIFREYGNEENY